MKDLDPTAARRIIEVVGSSGQPPEWGLHRFTVGLDDVLDVLDREYFSAYIREGGASFKMLVGAFGGGKTHSLYCVRELAWRRGFLVSYCPLGPEQSPFHRLDRVYKSIVDNLTAPGPGGPPPPAGFPRGLDAFLRSLHGRLLAEVEATPDPNRSPSERYDARIARSLRGVENINFARAVTAALGALFADRPDDYLHVLQWLTAGGYDRRTHRGYGILEPIGRGQAFSMIRSLAQWVRNLDVAGLVILFDEAEQVPSLTSRQRDLLLSNLRELIDQCGQASFPGVMIFYAIPNETIFEGRSAVYEALKQRIATVFDLYNPSGVKIRLERLGAEPIPLLREIGARLFAIYSIPWSNEIPPERVDLACARLAEAAFEERFGDIGSKRLFVQAAIRAFHALRADPDLEPDDEWARGLVGAGLT